MQNSPYKKIEIVGTTSKPFSEAVENGIKRAAKTVENTAWFEVFELRGCIDDGAVGKYQITLKLGFRLDG